MSSLWSEEQSRAPVFGTDCSASSHPVGVLLPELVVSIVLLLTRDAGLMQETGSIPLLAGLLEHLDRFDHLAPGHQRDDNEDLAWPGLMGTLVMGVGEGFHGVKRLKVKEQVRC